MVQLRRKHPIVQRLFKVFLDKDFQGTYINKMYQELDTLYANIKLPEHKERADLDKLLPNLQQEVGATAVKIGKIKGKSVEILFGMRELGDEENPMLFTSSLLHDDSLKITFPSAYGEYILDFEDGSSCHMLNGGVTRMGKTCLILYLATTIFLQQKGNVTFYISSTKLKDYYPFYGIPNVKMSKEEASMERLLQELKKEYKTRDELLYSPALRKATDAKSVRKLYPEHYHLFKPIFLFIDEYARFAENKKIQKLVTEIVETAGYVNVHVIIASQRPDATTVLKARIRANLLCRLAFTTADRKNSEVILDREGAEKLGKIAGRAILIDGDSDIVQVPFLDVVDCDKLLASYQIEENTEDEQITEGCNDTEVVEQVQSIVKESDSLDDLFGEFKPSECGKQSFAEDVYGWDDSTSTKRKG